MKKDKKIKLSLNNQIQKVNNNIETEKLNQKIQDDLQKKNYPILRNIIIGIIIIFFILITIKLIDDYTGWGNFERVIKKNIDAADKNAIYKKYDAAIGIYENLLKKFSKNTKYSEYIRQIKLNLAKTYKEANENIKAINLFKELLEDYKDNKDMYAWILLEIGETYNDMYNVQDAIKTYEKILEEYKDTDWAAEAIFGIAESYKISGKPDIAIKYYNEIVKKYKNGFLSAEALTNIAQIYEKQGKEKEALKIYQKIINEFPDIVTEYAKLRYSSITEKLKNK